MAANLPSIAITDDINSPDYDAIVVVSPDVKSISLDRVKDPLTTYLSSNRILPSIFVTKLLPFWFILLAAQLWLDTYEGIFLLKLKFQNKPTFEIGSYMSNIRLEHNSLQLELMEAAFKLHAIELRSKVHRP